MPFGEGRKTQCWCLLIVSFKDLRIHYFALSVKSLLILSCLNGYPTYLGQYSVDVYLQQSKEIMRRVSA